MDDLFTCWLALEDDVLADERELARRQDTTAGMLVTRPLRAALSVAGFRPFHDQAGAVVTNEQIDQLRDEAGL